MSANRKSCFLNHSCKKWAKAILLFAAASGQTQLPSPDPSNGILQVHFILWREKNIRSGLQRLTTDFFAKKINGKCNTTVQPGETFIT
jgi:hypothetical protein